MPRISIFNVTVFENVGTVVIPINRTGGDLSRSTVIRASSRDVTASSSGKRKLSACYSVTHFTTHASAGAGQDYVAQSNFRIRWLANQVDPRPEDPAFEFTIIDDDIPEAREYFEIDLSVTRNGVFFPPYAVGRVTILDTSDRKCYRP